MKALIILIFSFASIAEAKFYSCQFTEPFFTLYLSTTSHIVTKASFYKSDSLGTHIEKVHSTKTSDHFTFKNGERATIYKSKSGSDGMSDFSYPYDIQYKGYWGGCTSEDIWRSAVIERTTSSSSPAGRTLNQFWPGEYFGGHQYKFNKDVQFKKSESWKSITGSGEPATKSCTIKRGKVISPLAENGSQSKYWSLSNVFTWKALEPLKHLGDRPLAKGDIFYELSYLSEGVCLIESSGKLYEAYCPSRDDESIISLDKDNQREIIPMPPIGYWTYTQCGDGHWTWINVDNFAAHSKDIERTTPF